MPERLLIVDDSRTMRTHLVTMLSAHYECRTAETAEEGVQLARTLSPPPDAVLMDVRMPGMGGIEGLRAIRSDPALDAIPVVMVTTRGEPEVVDTCRALGCAGFVNKPVATGELFAVVREVLRSRGNVA